MTSITIFEVLWINLHMLRLPRGYNNLVIGTVYHPPSADGPAMLNFLSTCLSTLESRFTNFGLNISRLTYIYNFDLVLINLHDFCNQPAKYALLGVSDHMCVVLIPKERSMLPKVRKIVTKKRDLRPSFRLAFQMYLELLDIPKLLDHVLPCTEKTFILKTIVETGLEHIMLLRTRIVGSTEPPWMTSKLSMMIRKRQTALNKGNILLCKLLRNTLNRKRKICRGKYYENSVRHLKQSKPSSW